MTVRLVAWNESAATGRIFISFDIGVFFERLSRKFKFHPNMARITGGLHDEEYALLIYRSVLFRMKSV